MLDLIEGTDTNHKKKKTTQTVQALKYYCATFQNIKPSILGHAAVTYCFYKIAEKAI